jgi:DNA-binding SARP family transcriptional activator
MASPDCCVIHKIRYDPPGADPASSQDACKALAESQKLGSHSRISGEELGFAARAAGGAPWSFEYSARSKSSMTAASSRLGGAKQRSTLAMLLLGRNQVVSRDQLIDGLWGVSLPPSAGSTLETNVSRLRRVLLDDGHGARLVTQPPGYRLRVEAGELDLDRFETLLDRARTAHAADDHEAAANDLREALSLVRGAPLEDLAHAPFARDEIGRLEELLLAALKQRLDVDLAVGRHAEVVGELESLALRNPFRETLWRQLMLALYRSGRQGEALNAFDRVRRILAEELGLEPGRTLQHLHRQILQQDRSLEHVPTSSGSAAVATSTAGSFADLTTLSGVSPSAPASAPPPMVAEPPATPPRGEHRVLRRRSPPSRRAFIAGVALALAAVLAATLVPRVLGGGDGATTTFRPTTAFRPGTALIDLATGKAITSIPLARRCGVRLSDLRRRALLGEQLLPRLLRRGRSEDGRILRQVNPPAWRVDVSRDSATLTPFAVQGNTLWSAPATTS